MANFLFSVRDTIIDGSISLQLSSNRTDVRLFLPNFDESLVFYWSCPWIDADERIRTSLGQLSMAEATAHPFKERERAGHHKTA
ncbi:hypothetical protein AB2B41_20880 [Marimonas sp. MJW-29]|uniref:Uncharacterized protein n=1 Tax=Sulfitobacter sediminis TaxID=3234186 RepID=A0ABV3RU43_9RHOB